MASPSDKKQKQESASAPDTPLRDHDDDLLMADATPLGTGTAAAIDTAQETRQGPFAAASTPAPAPRLSLLRRSIQTEYIATPRSSRASSTSSTDSVPIEPTPGMVPRGLRNSLRAQQQQQQQQQQRTPPPRFAQPATPYPGATPGLPTMPSTSTMMATPRASLSSLASSSSFRSSVLAGERPMPATPAQATMGTPQEVPERRRSNRFVPRESLGVITPTNPTHRRASALFQPQSAAAREAAAAAAAAAEEEEGKQGKQAKTMTKAKAKGLGRASLSKGGLQYVEKKDEEKEEADKDKDKDVDMKDEKYGAEFKDWEKKD